MGARPAVASGSGPSSAGSSREGRCLTRHWGVTCSLKPRLRTRGLAPEDVLSADWARGVSNDVWVWRAAVEAAVGADLVLGVGVLSEHPFQVASGPYEHVVVAVLTDGAHPTTTPKGTGAIRRHPWHSAEVTPTLA